MSRRSDSGNGFHPHWGRSPVWLRFLVLALTFLTTACRADDRPETLTYGYVARDAWPVIIFPQFWNSPAAEVERKIAFFRSSGWEGVPGGTTLSARYFTDPGFENTLRIDAIWFEVRTGRFFEARLEADLRDLERDRGSFGSGLVQFRFGRNGEAQVMTVADRLPPPKPEVRVLARICGSEVEIADDAILQEIARIQRDQSLQQTINSRTGLAPPPSPCDGSE